MESNVHPEPPRNDGSPDKVIKTSAPLSATVPVIGGYCVIRYAKQADASVGFAPAVPPERVL